MASHVSTCMALLKAINMGVPIQFVGSSKKKEEGGRKGKEKGRKGKEKGRKRKEKERRKKKKKKKEERKKKEEKEGVSHSEHTQTVKNSKLRYKR